VLEVKKRIGANVVETIEGAKKVAEQFVAESKKTMPDLQVTYTQDKSTFVNQLLTTCRTTFSPGGHPSLHRYPLCAVGARLDADRPSHSVIISHGHPGAGDDGLHDQYDRAVFADPGCRHAVDDAIIVTEYAERRMSEGMPKAQAFEEAAKRMAGPVIAATLTRIAAFSPLLFWPASSATS
jgi:multidrug efflux pump